MTRFYPECDQYECPVCPRRDECDIRDDDGEDATIPLDLDANPDQLRVLDELERKLVSMQAEIAMLNIAVKSLMRNESELLAALGRWVEGVEGGDHG